jgi:putative PEP-CTERM system histidine kinase
MLLATFSITCAFVYGVFGAVLAFHSQRNRAVSALVVATLTTALWALAATADGWLESRVPGSLEAIDVLRVSAWLAFLGVAVTSGELARRERRFHGVVAVLVAALAGALVLDALQTGSPVARGRLGSWYPVGRAVLGTIGLVWIEVLLRRARSEGHDRTRYLCLGVGALLAFDVLSWSQMLLFHRADPLLFAIAPGVYLLAAPLIGLGAARNRAFAIELNLARRAVVHSATLFALGGYLLALAGLGTVLRETGGSWGRNLQVLALCGGFLVLAFVWLSPSLRAGLRFRLGSYLFTHRHDYREQWQRFARALSGAGDPSSRAADAVAALADVVGSHWGALWLRDGDGFALVASQGIEAAASGEIAEGAFTAWVESAGGDVVVLVPHEPGQPDVPPGLAWGWVAVPLVRERLVGFAVLSRPRGRASLHPEDREVLRIAGFHTASALLADQRARRLGEVQRFEEVSRGLAFVAHDLRNVANELTLALANARAHIARPEFQRDLILSMEDSVQSMQKLLDKVARRRHDAPSSEPVDLVQMALGAVRTRRATHAGLKLEHAEGETLPIVGAAEQLASLCGHLVQNAVDAAGPAGRVEVRLRREGRHAVLEISDDGAGMAEADLRDRLRHPFQSTKETGFGLGLYECRLIARQLGGDLEIESAPGHGTRARVRLPLAADGSSKGGS